MRDNELSRHPSLDASPGPRFAPVVAIIFGLVLATIAGAAYAWDTRPFEQPSIQTRPNIFGGVTIDQGFGKPTIETRPNIFGGFDIDRGIGQPKTTCRPNIFGGLNCD